MSGYKHPVKVVSFSASTLYKNFFELDAEVFLWHFFWAFDFPNLDVLLHVG